MATCMGPREVGSLSEVVVAQAFELGAILNLVKRKGVLTKAEVLGEIKHLPGKATKAH